MGEKGGARSSEGFLRERKAVRAMSIGSAPVSEPLSRYSILPAITKSGILYCEIVEGSFNGASFAEFVEGVLRSMQPYPAPRSVLIMDNCPIHKNDEIRRLVEARWALSFFCIVFSTDQGFAEVADSNTFRPIHPTTIPSSFPSRA